MAPVLVSPECHVDMASVNGISKEGPAECEKYHTGDTSSGSGKREDLIWAGG